MSKDRHHTDNQIAIVGMSCIFPGAPDLKTFWQNIAQGKDALADLPDGRLHPVHFDPSSHDPDRIYCRRGGFIDPHASFDPLAFGITPTMAADGEPDQFLALKVARRAMIDAGYDKIEPLNGGVIIGKGSYQNSAGHRYNQRMRVGQQLVFGLQRLIPNLDDKTAEAIRQLVQKEIGPYRPENTIALVPSFTASWVANRMDLQGPAYTVDAACASSLIAVKNACEFLRAGICDLMIAGGMHIFLDIGFWSVFCQLGIMSPSSSIRPLSRSADGLLAGEGVGLVVLKRLADAIERQDRIYAVIRGVGVACDGRASSIMKPLVEGQLRAIEHAWGEADLKRDSIGLIEAHSPGTPVGDMVELTTLAKFFGPPGENERPGVIGSVKSNIGHTMPAAGAAGLIKAALAVYHGKLPPTLACNDPHPLLENTLFRTVSEAIAWPKPAAERIAGVNAFGFGGTNAHVLLQGFDPRESAAGGLPYQPFVPRARLQTALILEASTRDDLLRQLKSGGSRAPLSSGGRCRLVVLDPDRERVARAHKIVTTGTPWLGRYGIFFSDRGLLSNGGKIAFMYPGVEAEFDGDLAELSGHFGLEFPSHLATLRSHEEKFNIDKIDLEGRGVGIILMAELITEAMHQVGIKADLMMGHSIGEWSGLIAAGVIGKTVVKELIATLKRNDLKIPEVDFGLVGCGYETAQRGIAGLADISISHDNCPHQCILCGKAEAMTIAFDRLQKEHVICKLLPFKSGFHSPLFSAYLSHMQKYIDSLTLSRGHTPMWSALSCELYPDDPAKIKELLRDGLVHGVRFRSLTEQLYTENVRAFVQIGSGTLHSFIADTLGERPHLSVTTNAPKTQGVSRLMQAALALYAEGAEIDWSRLPLSRTAPPAGEIMLDLATRFVECKDAAWDQYARQLGAGSAGAGADELAQKLPQHPLTSLFLSNMDSLKRVQRDVMQSFERNAASWREDTAASPAKPSVTPAPTPLVLKQRWSKPMSAAEYPELVDHSFFPQPVGWENLIDKVPIAPMTMLLEIMMQEAQKLLPHLIPVGLENVKAKRWMAVEPPVEAQIVASVLDGEKVKISIEDYVESTVLFAGRYPAPLAADTAPLPDEQPMSLSVQKMYDDYMFHGPAYQGAVALNAAGRGAIRGTIVVKKAVGCLLDTAGQFFGLWVILNAKTPCMPFPLFIKRITFFGPQPPVGEKLVCTCRDIEHGISADVSGNFVLSYRDKAWSVIEKWTDYVFVEDEITNAMLHDPGHKIIPIIDEQGLAWLTDKWPEQGHKDRMMHRYLADQERVQYRALPPENRTERLLKTMIGKDLLRHYFWSKGHDSIFPVEIELDFTDPSRPGFHTAFDHGWRPALAFAYQEPLVVAMLGEGDGKPAIELERVDERAQWDKADAALLTAHGADHAASAADWAARLKAARALVRRFSKEQGDVPLQKVAGSDVMLSNVWIKTASHMGFAAAFAQFSG